MGVAVCAGWVGSARCRLPVARLRRLKFMNYCTHATYFLAATICNPFSAAIHQLAVTARQRAVTARQSVALLLRLRRHLLVALQLQLRVLVVVVLAVAAEGNGLLVGLPLQLVVRLLRLLVVRLLRLVRVVPAADKRSLCTIGRTSRI